MSNQLYILAIILFILWAFGFFAFGMGSLIHILLVVAIITVLFKIIKESDTV